MKSTIPIQLNKNKIINDPVFGFITIQTDLLYSIIQHPIFQRLSRIRQLGLVFYVYPGAQHTRFHHSLGAMHLMEEAIKTLRFKGVEITNEEAQAAMACILLHDIGHGPCSHVLENVITKNLNHEKISLLFMEKLNRELKGKLDLCISIFKNVYKKKFLYQLVSGQLDVDRLDYLRRDSYYTGVSEGNIGSARIIKMLDVREDKLVIEEKGIYSIEDFLTSRRTMYWQVYLHKTAIAAECMLHKIFERVRDLVLQGAKIDSTPALKFFMERQDTLEYYESRDDEYLEEFLDNFMKLDDNDIWCSLKMWQHSDDKILSILSNGMINRKLFKISLTSEKINQLRIDAYKENCIKVLEIDENIVNYLFVEGAVDAGLISESEQQISILQKNGQIKDISKASDILDFETLYKKTTKNYFAYYPL